MSRHLNLWNFSRIWSLKSKLSPKLFFLNIFPTKNSLLNITNHYNYRNYLSFFKKNLWINQKKNRHKLHSIALKTFELPTQLSLTYRGWASFSQFFSSALSELNASLKRSFIVPLFFIFKSGHYNEMRIFLYPTPVELIQHPVSSFFCVIFLILLYIEWHLSFT